MVEQESKNKRGWEVGDGAPGLGLKNRRKRGGQPSNLNAIKHGFYSRILKSSDVKDVNNYEFQGLNDEISLFRVQIRRFTEMSDKIQTFEESSSYMRTLSHAIGQLARLVKIQHYITGGRGNWEDVLGQALSEAIAEQQVRQDNMNPASPNSLPRNLEDTFDGKGINGTP